MPFKWVKYLVKLGFEEKDDPEQWMSPHSARIHRLVFVWEKSNLLNNLCLLGLEHYLEGIMKQRASKRTFILKMLEIYSSKRRINNQRYSAFQETIAVRHSLDA